MNTLLKAICDYAFLAQGGKLCIIGIFESMNVQSLPYKHPTMTFVLALEGEANKLIDYYFTIEDPSGKIVVDKMAQKIQTKISPNGKLNLIINVIGVSVEKEGVHKVHLFAGDLKDTLEFDVKSLPKARA